MENTGEELEDERTPDELADGRGIKRELPRVGAEGSKNTLDEVKRVGVRAAVGERRQVKQQWIEGSEDFEAIWRHKD